MFKVFYKYSACIKIVTDDISILCDPWLTSEAYYGAWGQYPSDSDMINKIGKYDIIYISHIHPDHYCKRTIEELNEKYGMKPILIADWGRDKNFLKNKILRDTLKNDLITANLYKAGRTTIKLIPNALGTGEDIDSVILVSDERTSKAVLNINDCIGNDILFERINDHLQLERIHVSLFCLGYTGAGPYPQTYYSPFCEKEILERLAENKKESFIRRYLTAVSAVKSEKRLPFAGKYILKGELSALNAYRGVTDAVEMTKFDEDAVVLDDGGQEYFDLETMTASSIRTKRYQVHEDCGSDNTYTWRKDIGFTPDQSLLRRLLAKALINAHKRSKCIVDCFWSIYIYSNASELYKIWSTRTPWLLYDALATFNCNSARSVTEISCEPHCHAHMFIEDKALFAVLTGVTHWNNYEVGSILQVRRFPDLYIEEMYSYLHFLSLV